MLFSEAIRGVELTAQVGPDVDVVRVDYDSRRVGPGWIFLAMRGGSVDGNRFISSAVERGASAVVTDDADVFGSLQVTNPKLTLGLCGHGRKALAGIAANLLQHPERRLKICGVTGTNGKTTTAFLLEAMLEAAGRKTALVGTIAYHLNGKVLAAPHTTPESSDLLALFAEAADGGATEAVMEVSSHALAQGRVWGIAYDVAIFTNLTRDHLDFHGTMEDYFAAKRQLFVAGGTGTVAPRVAVVNVDDAAGRRLHEAMADSSTQVVTYGWDAGDFHAKDVALAATGSKFTMVTPAGEIVIETRLAGRVNVWNILGAAAAATARGVALVEIATGVRGLASVPGRFEQVDAGQPFAVVVDYAHTDDALRNLTRLARELVSPQHGRVITLFGCGGDRDKAKRPLMAKAAAENSDFVVLTSDNPRSEDPLAILRDAEAGFAGTATKYVVIEDRATAICEAIGHARPGDIVLLAGKGHEKTQTTRDGVHPFDDVAVARAVLQELAAGAPTICN
jgi:UDP-N-acetylmuramoyl-L-alanyl-D-glutamate--2,6-diaminopimelate ligase